MFEWPEFEWVTLTEHFGFQFHPTHHGFSGGESLVGTKGACDDEEYSNYPEVITDNYVDMEFDAKAVV